MLVESEMEILPVTSNNLDYGKKIIVTYNDYFEFLYLNPSYPVEDEVTFDKLIDRFITSNSCKNKKWCVLTYMVLLSGGHLSYCDHKAGPCEKAFFL